MLDAIHVYVSLIVLICVLIIHYVQHFACKVSCKRNTLPPQMVLTTQTTSAYNQNITATMMNIVKNRRRCCCFCRCIPVDGSTFNFFPVSYLFYILFLILLCCLIVFNVKSKNDSILFSVDSTTNSKMPILHYILIYGIIVLSTWESLHAFYGFYTTYFSVVHGYFISTTTVLLRFFLFYGTMFLLIFLLEIHLFYWLFPIVVLLHVSFNCYCTLQFARILIKSYQKLVTKNNLYMIQDELKNINFMRKISIICCILQAIYLCVFFISHNLNTICYLPLVWSLSAVIYMLNFVRNRILYRKITHHIKSKCQIATDTTLPKTQSADNISDPSAADKQLQTKKAVRNSKALHLLGLVTPGAASTLSTHKKSMSLKYEQHSNSLSKLAAKSDELQPTIKLKRSHSNNVPLMKNKKAPHLHASLSHPILLTTKMTPSNTGTYTPFDSISSSSDPLPTALQFGTNEEFKPDFCINMLDFEKRSDKNQLQAKNDIVDTDMNAARSLNVLSQHGFYSRQSINGIYELKQYLQ